MFKPLRLCLLIFPMMLALSACLRESYSAEIPLGNGAIARVEVIGLFGYHSDWERRFTVETRDGQIAQDLFSDTGWWRGSHLYLHRSGTYLVHEGQNGCFAFILEPLAFRTRAEISCEKQDVPEHGAHNTFEGFPASKHYSALYYVGRWDEQGPNHPKGRLIFQTFE